jgi:hypothetical protein
VCVWCDPVFTSVPYRSPLKISGATYLEGEREEKGRGGEREEKGRVGGERGEGKGGERERGREGRRKREKGEIVREVVYEEESRNGEQREHHVDPIKR